MIAHQIISRIKYNYSGFRNVYEVKAAKNPVIIMQPKSLDARNKLLVAVNKQLVCAQGATCCRATCYAGVNAVLGLSDRVAGGVMHLFRVFV